ncbi:putative MULE transposase domain-containing protein [Dioscorea sansibarensis]
MYVCLAPLKAGFMAGCRPVISVDGCWLKGLFGGHLLSAVGIDANDCIYPIAWAVVEKENHANWRWFLELLAADLEINNSHHWAFMSDRQKE